jgi:signal transduction histidine kinase
MPKRWRHRLVTTTFALVVGVAVLFCFGLYAAFEVAENKLLDTHLARDVESLIELYEQYPEAITAPHQNFRVFVTTAGDTDSLPAALADLAPDVDDVLIDGREYDLQVHRRGAQTFYFLFDESAFESFEVMLFIIMSAFVGGIAIVAGWLSIDISRPVINPLTKLANEVAMLDDHSGQGVTVPGDGRAGDEISLLALAIAGYHQRIRQLLHREREFSSDLSHELRTPLMAVQGAAELLERRLGAQSDMLELTARIRRGCLHMTTLTDALPYLARDPSSFNDMIEPVRTLVEII